MVIQECDIALWCHFSDMWEGCCSLVSILTYPYPDEVKICLKISVFLDMMACSF
jgi:hypothetical protein